MILSVTIKVVFSSLVYSFPSGRLGLRDHGGREGLPGNRPSNDMFR